MISIFLVIALVGNPYLRLGSSTVTALSITQFDPSLSDILDLQNYRIQSIANFDVNLAHEGPVFIEQTNEVYFTSNRFVDAATQAQHIDISKINLKTNVVTKVTPSPEILMSNGATLFSKQVLLICSQGYNATPGALYVLDTRTLIAKKLELQPQMDFSSPNDVVVSTVHNGYFFTDPPYGYYQNFRPKNTLPPAVYYVNRQTLQVTALDSGFTSSNRPNGVVESADGKVLYVSDTGVFIGNGTNDPSVPRAIYAYDIISNPNGAPTLTNRRFLVGNVTAGAADGIKLDTKGNLYAGVDGGVDIYATPSGTLLGKIPVVSGETVANLVFAGNVLLMLTDTTIYSVTGFKVSGLSMPGGLY